MKSDIVSVVKSRCNNYPNSMEAFRPSNYYPEYPFEEYATTGNVIYESVREALHLLELDNANYGTANWNPFGEFIKPGMTVLIKPNLVMDINRNPNSNTDCLYTNPSVVAPIVDYVYLALKGNGKIIIGDAPVQECDFSNLLQTSGYKELVQFYQTKKVNVDIVDFRAVKTKIKDGIMYSEEYPEAEGTIVDLSKESAFSGLSAECLRRLRITNYKPELLHRHHNMKKHEYMISNYILDADVIINMPKPKTHRIAGMTASLKNFVGANVRKEYLPHHTLGNVKNDGDESDIAGIVMRMRAWFLDKKNENEYDHRYKMAKVNILGVRICSLLLKLSGSSYREGCWYGNNTINKTITDINKIVYFTDSSGSVREKTSRTVFIVADMIVAGEGEGPMAPLPKEVGIIAAGFNPVNFDETIATLMGLDIKKIPTLRDARDLCNKYKINDDYVIKSNVSEYDDKHIYEIKEEETFRFIPTLGWKGNIELVRK